MLSLHRSLSQGCRFRNFLLLLDEADCNLHLLTCELAVHLKLGVGRNIFACRVMQQHLVARDGERRHLSLAFLFGKLGRLAHLSQRHLGPLVEEDQCQALVGGNHQDVWPGEAKALELHVAHTVEPPQLPPIVLHVVESLVCLAALEHLRARHDGHLVSLFRPGVGLEHPDLVLYTARRALVGILHVFLLELVAERHVREHGG
mmetsp:Transcript_3091/g.7151  ORF Transcript_3091/g.7151 Transcript_3091/m.7151 type:complete len:203 (+) Transcript_3091:240-848(+)